MSLKINNLLNNVPHSLTTKKRGRPKKQAEPIITKTQESTSVTKNKKSETDYKLDKIKWNSTIDHKPEKLKPIVFHTNNSKVITGYRVNGGYITDTPYWIDMFKRSHGFIEWQYISNCSNLRKCPNGFPSCSICKNKGEK